MSVEPWRCASCFFFLSGRSTHTYLEPTGRRALFRQRASSFFPFFFSPLSCFLDRAQPAAASTPSGFCRAAKKERRRRGPAAALQSLTSDLLVLLSGALERSVCSGRQPKAAPPCSRPRNGAALEVSPPSALPEKQPARRPNTRQWRAGETGPNGRPPAVVSCGSEIGSRRANCATFE